MCSLEVHNYPASTWEQTQEEEACKKEYNLKRMRRRKHHFLAVLQRRQASPPGVGRWEDPLGGKWCKIPELSSSQGSQAKKRKGNPFKGVTTETHFLHYPISVLPLNVRPLSGKCFPGFRPSFHFLLKAQKYSVHPPVPRWMLEHAVD